jgi:hypothetical protein
LTIARALGIEEVTEEQDRAAKEGFLKLAAQPLLVQ